MRLAEMKLLQGQKETITMSDLRSRPGDVIAQVQQGKHFEVTKSGNVVAQLSEPEPGALQLGAEVRRLGLDRGLY